MAAVIEDDLSWKRRMEERVTALEAVLSGTQTDDDNSPMSTALVPMPSTSSSSSAFISSPVFAAQQNHCLVEENGVKNEQLKYFVENIGGGGVFQPCCDGGAQLFTSQTKGYKYLFINPSPQFDFTFEFHPDGVVKETELLKDPSKKFPQSVVEPCSLILVPVTFQYEIHNLEEDQLEALNQVYPDLKRYKAGKQYTSLYVIAGGSAAQQGILFEGTLTKGLDKGKVPLISQLMNKLTGKVKMSGLEPKGKKIKKILHKFGETVSVPKWDLLVIFWIIETIVKRTEDLVGGPLQLNNLDPFSNEEDLQIFFKRVGSLMKNGGYPSWNGETKALVEWVGISNLKQDEEELASLPPPPPPPAGGDEVISDSEDSSILSLFVPVQVKTKKEKDGNEMPKREKIENGRKAVNVKIKRKWVQVKINDVQGQQAWEDGKKVKVSLEDVKKKEK